MSNLVAVLTGLQQGLARVLPPHEFTVHRHGGDRPRQTVIKVGTETQVMAIASAVLVAGWLGVATNVMLTGNSAADAALASKDAELARMQHQIQAMKSETAALKGDVAARAEMLESRQQFLAALLSDRKDMAKLARMLPRAGDGSSLATVAALVAPTPPTSKRKRGKAQLATVAVPAGARFIEPFRKLEDQQLAFVDKATGAAEAKLRDTQALIRRLGLDPARFVVASDWNGATRGQSAVGGPFIPVSADAEPRFKDLFLSCKRLSNLQSAVAAIPAFMPVKEAHYTSGFGYRFDPFTGSGAHHAGIDLAGVRGEPIYAAASGVVVKSAMANGYGNMVELNHGHGIETRYGHMSTLLVRAGEVVRQGQIIGRMGSTGRSTGTHLHYEVRVDGRAVDAKPFLDASAFMLAAQSETAPGFDSGAPQDFGPVLADDTVTAPGGGAPMSRIRLYRR